MKDNVLPKGLVPLEILFDANDVAVDSKKTHQEEEMEYCNLGTQQEPKIVKLFKGVPENYKERYIHIFKKYMDVFSWSYEDLKTYDKISIEHKIPFKEGLKPHRQKLR